MDVVTGFKEEDIAGIEFEKDGDWLLVKAKTPVENQFIVNGSKFLTRMAGTGFAPEARYDDRGLWLKDLGASEPVTDEVIFRRSCARLLIALREKKIRHGDLTSKNIIVKDDKLIVVDWWQAKDAGDWSPDKRPEGDAYHLWRVAAELSPDTSRHIRRWIAIREHLGLGSLIDLGTAEGDFCLFAASEQPRDFLAPTIAVDIDPEAITRAGVVCKGLELSYRACDIMDVEDFMYDTVFLLSTWAHILKKHGQLKGRQLLKRITEQAGQLIFETQLNGDGPGPSFLRTDDDVYEMLAGYGNIEKLITIPVVGRDASRSVWRVMR